jgi:O-antigen/teichoic acid export membrane protein
MEPSQEPTRPAAIRAPLTTGRVVARNVLFGGFNQVWSVVLMVIAIPIVLHGLGDAGYGLFVLVSLLLGYVGFLDLGLTPALVRSLSLHYTTTDDAGLSRYTGTALTVLLGMGLLGGIVIALAAPALVTQVLHIPPALRADAVFVLDLAAVGFALNMCLTLFGAVPQAMQRLDLFTMRSFVLTTATVLAQIAAVRLGGGLRWVAGVTVGVNVLSLLIFVVVARQLLPKVSFRPRFDRSAFRELASFGSLRFINQASGQIVFQFDRLIVAAFLPIRAVTFYSIPLTIAQKFTTVQSVFSGAFFPAASELHGLEQRDRLQRLYLASMKLSIVLTIPLVVMVVGFAHQILATWIDPSIAAASSGVLVVLAIAYGFATVIGVPALASDATGHPHWTAAFAVASALINLVLTILLVPRLGPIGAAYALLINSVTQGMIFIAVVQHRFLRVPAITVVRKAIVRPLLAGIVLAGYVVLAASHITSFLILVLTMAGGSVLYAASTAILGVWDQHERAIAAAMARSALARLPGGR